MTACLYFSFQLILNHITNEILLLQTQYIMKKLMTRGGKVSVELQNNDNVIFVSVKACLVFQGSSGITM